MNKVTNIEDRIRGEELNDYLDSQSISASDELLIALKSEEILSNMVEDAISDIRNDSLSDALIDCENEWRDFIGDNIETCYEEMTNEQTASFVKKGIALTNKIEYFLRERMRVSADEQALENFWL